MALPVFGLPRNHRPNCSFGEFRRCYPSCLIQTYFFNCESALSGFNFQNLKQTLFVLAIVLGGSLWSNFESCRACQSPPGLGGEGGASSNGVAGDGGDSPSLPSPTSDYVAYAVTNLPDHFTSAAQGSLPPTNDDNTPVSNPITNAGATLGRVLFYDVRLSHNNTVSCASCHLQELGFTDHRLLSVGADGRAGLRRSMGLSNSKFYRNKKFRWDETAENLEAQALLPIQHVDEMNQDLSVLISKLNDASFYGALFEAAFGDPVITEERISRSLAQFTRSMVSYDSKFDLAYTSGTNSNPDFAGVFTQQEMHGLRLFGGQVNDPELGRELHCFRCHITTAHIGREAVNNGLDLDTSADQGAGSGRFKVTSLRNVAIRGRFMHDGRFASLSDVVDHYDQGVKNHPALSGILKDQGQPTVLNLSGAEKAALIAFLETLTGTQLLQDEMFSDPFPIHLPEVDTVEVDDNGGQRSAVRSITVRMDGVIDVESDALTVVQRSDGGGPTGKVVSTSFSTSVVAGQTVIAITFGSEIRNAEGALNDGHYELTIDSSKVFRDGRPMLESFIYGDEVDETFFTHFGDTDADRDVDFDDFGRFVQTYRKVAGEPGFNETVDFDADGDVDNIDFAYFVMRYGSTLSFN